MHQLGFVDQRLIIFPLVFLNCCCFCFLCFNPLTIFGPVIKLIIVYMGSFFDTAFAGP